jgi:DNA-binding CsgD family transcriptional regulator
MEGRGQLHEASEAENVAVPAAKLAALDGVISGGGLKLAVHTLGRTQSTVAVHIKQALAFVGLRRALSRTPATLIQAVTAAQGLYVVARSARVQHGGEHLQVVSTLRPEAPIAPLLTSCERDVVSRFLDGESYAEIARGRQRSVRTVANQLSAVFRRVGVSGRLEFVSHLTLLVACRAELKSSA